MSTVVALGERHELEGFALVGATIVTARTDDEISSGWRNLGPDVGLVILSSRAADVLRSELSSRPDILTAVLP